MPVLSRLGPRRIRDKQISAARLFEFDSLSDLVLTARAFIGAAIMARFVNENAH